MKQQIKLLPNKIKRALPLVVLDSLLVVVCGGLALLTRFDFLFSQIPGEYLSRWQENIPLQIVVVLAVFILTGMYRYLWTAVGSRDVLKMMLSVLAAYAVNFVVSVLLHIVFPKGVWLLEAVYALCFMVGYRCIPRFSESIHCSLQSISSKDAKRVMLIGAGNAGKMLAHELSRETNTKMVLACVIDDDESTWGKKLEGVTIVGGRDRIIEAAKREKIDQIVFAIPTATAAQKRDILDICKMAGCEIRLLPEKYHLIKTDELLSKVQRVQIADLLGREQVRLNNDVIESFLTEKVVLVTGGGGSIGSELCRQIAVYHPRKLVVLDCYENGAYEIQQELKRTYGKSLNLHVEIASVRDKERVYALFEKHHPDVVFHAAAHKHVPLMEDCASEAIKNNIFGTYHVVRASERFGVRRFVMISTDKAVNPTNVMGATKRFCEMILQSRMDSVTEFCSVRFGNVLGSNGSVVPLFQKQIEQGGPVTITDKRITRFFMTIPEAAQLVLECGAIAKPGQIFVLDMGEPVKILTLAENLIRLSGLEPYKDIDIQEIGLRPGEKLYEELLMKRDHLSQTENAKIFIEQQEPIDPDRIMQHLVSLDQAVSDKLNNEAYKAILHEIVPTFKTPEEVNARVEEKYEQVSLFR